MRFLSAKRRHPAVKVLMLLFALVVIGGVYSLVSPTEQVSADTGKSQQIAEGRALFAVGCGSCHGLNGEGQVSGTIQGPPLIGVGAASVDFQVSTGRMPMAATGQQAPKKPRVYSDEEIAALAAFVASLGPGPEIPTPEQYDPTGLSEEDIARGGELFRTNCSACHNFAGAGGALPNGKHAPTLEGVENRHIYQAMQTGPQQMPAFPDRALSSEEKRQIIGYLNHLHEQPNQGGLTLGALGPVSEGFWAWVAGLGVLVIFTVWITAKGARAK